MKRFFSSLTEFTGFITGKIAAIIGIRFTAFIILQLFLLLVIKNKPDLLAMVIVVQFPATLWVITKAFK